MVERLTNGQLQARADSEMNAHVQAAFIELIQRRNLEESMTQGSGIDDVARKIRAAVSELQTQESPGLMDNRLGVVLVINEESALYTLELTPTDLEAAVFALATVRGQLTLVADQIAALQATQSAANPELSDPNQQALDL